MKIDQPVTFLKNGAGKATVATAKGGASVQDTAPPAPAVAGAAQATQAALLPSTNGDFDAARVAEIRASISAGRYPINPAKIADGLLSTVHELLNKKTP
jgi:negative regulator of flagellin synthesis FlgM